MNRGLAPAQPTVEGEETPGAYADHTFSEPSLQRCYDAVRTASQNFFEIASARSNNTSITTTKLIQDLSPISCYLGGDEGAKRNAAKGTSYPYLYEHFSLMHPSAVMTLLHLLDESRLVGLTEDDLKNYECMHKLAFGIGIPFAGETSEVRKSQIVSGVFNSLAGLCIEGAMADLTHMDIEGYVKGVDWNIWSRTQFHDNATKIQETLLAVITKISSGEAVEEKDLKYKPQGTTEEERQAQKNENRIRRAQRGRSRGSQAGNNAGGGETAEGFSSESQELEQNPCPQQ